MKAENIRRVLKSEAEQLAHDGSFGASEALMSFARQATPAELVRFRDLIKDAEDNGDWWNQF